MILLIINSCLLFSKSAFPQVKKSFDDSVLLKKEIDSVLHKYGLKSKGFLINVISINQTGGQTAYSITNNYYSDPNYLSDSINYIVKTVIKDSVKYLYFSPKKGAWISPFIVYESFSGTKETSLMGFISTLHFTLKRNTLNIPFLGMSSNNPCSINSPIYIKLKKDENILIGFGDYSSNSKCYLYIDGDIEPIPMNINLDY